MAFARRSETAVTVRSGGHDFAGRSTGTGIVLDLVAMHTLEVAGSSSTIRASRFGLSDGNAEEPKSTIWGENDRALRCHASLSPRKVGRRPQVRVRLGNRLYGR